MWRVSQLNVYPKNKNKNLRKDFNSNLDINWLAFVYWWLRKCYQITFYRNQIVIIFYSKCLVIWVGWFGWFGLGTKCNSIDQLDESRGRERTKNHSRIDNDFTITMPWLSIWFIYIYRCVGVATSLYTYIIIYLCVRPCVRVNE